MSQHDYDIANGTGAAVRVDINNALEAIQTNNSGAEGDLPSTKALMFFADTENDLMKIRNEANNNFINLFTLAGGPAFPIDGTINSVNIGKGANSVSTNTVLGEEALDAAVTGGNCVAIGKRSLTTNTSGSQNIGIGMEALKLNTTGSNNIGVGHAALQSNTTADNNTAVGRSALGANETGAENTAVGANALDANTTGTPNTAIGYNSLTTNTTGGSNTACGKSALQNNTTANHNTAVGNNCLLANETGADNTAVGSLALDANTTANQNTAVGRSALSLNSTGQRNTAVGANAGNAITTGGNNLILGYDSDASSATVNNEITLGNSSIATLRCNTQTISSLSDARDKTNVIDLPEGLDFLTNLRPVKFEWATRDGNGKDGSYEHGFIAQDLQAVQKENNADYLNMVMDENPDRLEASYGKLVPILVKAIQELTIEVNKLKSNG